MKVEIEGENCEVPICTCGKCTVRRMRKGFFTNFPYNPNIASTYGNDYEWRTNENSPNFYNRSKHTGFEGAYRENLPTSLISTMKFDYRPFKVTLEEKEPEKEQVPSIPFIGRSTHQTKFPHWGNTLVTAKPKVRLPEIKVPLNGDSNYKENYVKYDPNFYQKRDLANPGNSNLNFYGKINPETTYGTSYKPIDFNQPHYFQKERPNKYTVEGKSTLEPAKFPKSNFESLYSQSFQDYKDKKCELADYFKKKGLKHLEI